MNKNILVLAALLLFSSCSKKLSFFNSNDKFNLSNVEYEYLSLKSKVKYDDGQKKQKATANIRIKKDSLIWFSVTPGMGIEAIRGVINSEEFILVDRIHKNYTRRPIQEFADKAHFKLDLSLLESILIGNLMWPVERKDDIENEEGYYIIAKTKGPLEITNYIGTHSMKSEKIHASSDSSRSTLDIHYKEFQKVNEHIVPKKIETKISYTNSKKIKNTSRIDIEHVKVDLSKENLQFPFSIPKKYKAL